MTKRGNLLSFNDCYKVSVNNFIYFYSTSMTLYQALIQKDWYIPRFCYHVKLLISGNCRMCVVEVENSLKPSISCSLLIQKTMNVLINSILVFKARESVLQFILNNHPLDCPICDQGGECDLQDQYIVMGSNESRYFELNKKFVNNKNISILLKLSLNKCINCSRCTRFSHMFVGDYSFSLLGRGESINISNYLKNVYFSEISGNTMDLCPVGAITSKFISYGFRIWEFNEINYIDYFDVFHPPIRIDYRGLKILRILPLMNDELKEEWISDRLRLNTKVFNKNRLFFSFVNFNNKNYKLSWKKLFKNMRFFFLNNIKFLLKKKIFYLSKINLSKTSTDFYNFIFFKTLFKKFCMFNSFYLRNKSDNEYRNSFFLDINFDFDFLEIDNFVLYNVNLRNEFPILNYKIREKSVLDFVSVLLFGFISNINYYFNFVNKNILFLFKDFKHLNLKNSLFLYSNIDISNNLLNFILCKENNLFSKFNLSYSNNLELLNNEFDGLKYSKSSDFVDKYTMNFSFLNISSHKNIKRSKIIFNFSNSNKVISDFVIPIKQVFEKSAIFLNLFGRINDFTFSTYRYFFKNLRNEWFIFKSFFNFLKIKIKFELSYFKHILFPRKWKYSGFSIKFFNYKYLKFDNFIKYKFFLYDHTLYFFEDVLSRTNYNLKYIFNLSKVSNLFNKFINLNKIYWLF